MYKLGVPSVTLEVGSKAAPGPISEFKKIWSKNKNVVIREAMLFD
jgi:g-D-glutamyl-meso-diaminopimelate peptidase